MRQIVTIHIGQTGVKTGQSCWELFCKQHDINLRGQKQQRPLHKLQRQRQLSSNKKCEEDLSVLFDQTRNGHFVPRANFFDMDPTTIDQLKKSKQKDLFNMNHVLSGKSAATTFGRGRYGQYGLLSKQLDQIRKIVERTHSFEGFVLSHSISGGTGSGFGSQLLKNLSMDYGKKIKISFTLHPSNKFSSSVVQPYQSVLSTHSLLQNTDACVVLDNETMYNVCERNLGIENPSFSNINHLIAQSFSCLTSFNRFPCSLGMNLQCLLTNSIPYPRIHFLHASLYPYVHPQKQHLFRFMSTQRITKQVFQKQNFLHDLNPHNGHYISSILIYRGNTNHKQVLQSLNKLKNEQINVKFVDWVETGFKVGLCSKPLFSSNIIDPNENRQIQDLNFKNVSDNSVFMLGNSTAIAETWARINYKFDMLYAKRAFLHWYVANQMEYSEFTDARQDLAALEKDYEEGTIQWEQGQQQFDSQLQF